MVRCPPRALAAAVLALVGCAVPSWRPAPEHDASPFGEQGADAALAPDLAAADVPVASPPDGPAAVTVVPGDGGVQRRGDGGGMVVARCVASAEGTGRGLLGQYFATPEFTMPKLARVDATIDYDWGFGAPDLSVPRQRFSVLWTGQVQPRYSGPYTIYAASSDGVRVWIDQRLVIDGFGSDATTEGTGTITLGAGQKYDVRIEYRDDGGLAVARLSWSSDCQAKEVIPSSQLYPPPATCAAPVVGTGHGLRAVLFDDADLGHQRLARMDPAVNFTWGAGSPDPMIKPGSFSVRWTGQVQPSFSGYYTFYTLSHDGIRVWVDGRVIVDDWNDHPLTEDEGTVLLEAGKLYALEVDYFNDDGDGTVQLSWDSECQARQVVPEDQLYPDLPPLECPAARVGAGTGLEGAYFATADLTTPGPIRLDPTVDFDGHAGQSPADAGAALLPPGELSVRWTGEVQPAFAGQTTFFLLFDGGARLWVDNQLIVDEWGDDTRIERARSLDLQAGQRYALKVEYHHAAGAGQASLAWSNACQPKEIIPAAQLYVPAGAGGLERPPDAGQ